MRVTQSVRPRTPRGTATPALRDDEVVPSDLVHDGVVDAIVDVHDPIAKREGPTEPLSLGGRQSASALQPIERVPREAEEIERPSAAVRPVTGSDAWSLGGSLRRPVPCDPRFAALADNPMGDVIVLHALTFGPLWEEITRRDAYAAR